MEDGAGRGHIHREPTAQQAVFRHVHIDLAFQIPQLVPAAQNLVHPLDQIVGEGKVVVDPGVEHDPLAVFPRQVFPIPLGILVAGVIDGDGDGVLVPEQGRVAHRPEVFRRVVFVGDGGGHDVVEVLHLVLHEVRVGADLGVDLHLGFGIVRDDEGVLGFVAEGVGGVYQLTRPVHPDVFLFQPDGAAEQQSADLRQGVKFVELGHVDLLA